MSLSMALVLVVAAVTLWVVIAASCYVHGCRTQKYLADIELEKAKIPRGMFGALPTSERVRGHE